MGIYLKARSVFYTCGDLPIFTNKRSGSYLSSTPVMFWPLNHKEIKAPCNWPGLSSPREFVNKQKNRMLSYSSGYRGKCWLIAMAEYKELSTRWTRTNQALSVWSTDERDRPESNREFMNISCGYCAFLCRKGCGCGTGKGKRFAWQHG